MNSAIHSLTHFDQVWDLPTERLMSPESFEKFNRMNHDLRTQLTVVAAGVHLLQHEGSLSEHAKELVKRMCRAIEKADSVLDLTYDELRKENY